MSVVELTTQLMPGCDPDLVRPLEKRLKARYEQIMLGTKVTAVKAAADGLHVTWEGPDGVKTEVFDKMLVSVGRRPNGKAIGAEAASFLYGKTCFVVAVSDETFQRLRGARRLGIEGAKISVIL